MTWNLEANDGCAGTHNACNDSNGSPAGFVGNIRTFTVTVDSIARALNATALSTPNNDGTGTFQRAWLGEYQCSGSCGLGVTNPTEMADPSSPNHTVDNNGKNDLIVFQFADATYVPASLVLNMFSTCPPNGCFDSDIDAWVGGNSIASLGSSVWTSLSYATLAANGFTKYNVSSEEATQCFGGACTRQRTVNLNSGGLDLAGKYLIIAADIDDSNDAFKIASLTGQLPDQTTQAVPEPATLALLCMGLAGFGLLAYRSK